MLGKDKSFISQEISRNVGKRGYSADRLKATTSKFWPIQRIFLIPPTGINEKAESEQACSCRNRIVHSVGDMLDDFEKLRTLLKQQ